MRTITAPVGSTIPLYSLDPQMAGMLGLQPDFSVPMPTYDPADAAALATTQMLSAAIPPTTLMPPPEIAMPDAGSSASLV